MSQVLLDGLYAALIDSQNRVCVEVGNRLYQDQKNATAQLPCIVYSMVADPVEHFFGNRSMQRAEVVFDIYGPLGNQPDNGGGSPKAQDVGELEAMLYQYFHGLTLTVTGHDRGLLVCRERGIPTTNDDSHQMTTRYALTACTA